MDFKYSPGKNSGRGNTLLSAWKDVALLNLHFAATCIEHCHSKLRMTNGGLSSLNLSQGCEASASTASSPRGVHGWCGKQRPTACILCCRLFLYLEGQQAMPRALTGWRCFGHNPEYCPFPHWKKGPTFLQLPPTRLQHGTVPISWHGAAVCQY